MGQFFLSVLLFFLFLCLDVYAMYEPFFAENQLTTQVTDDAIREILAKNIAETFSGIKSQTPDLSECSLEFKSAIMEKQLDDLAMGIVNFFGIRFLKELDTFVDSYDHLVKKSPFYDVFKFVYLNNSSWGYKREFINDIILDQTDSKKVFKFSTFISDFEKNCLSPYKLQISIPVKQEWGVSLMVLFYKLVKLLKNEKRVKYLICHVKNTGVVFYFDPIDGSLLGYLDSLQKMKTPKFFNANDWLFSEMMMRKHKKICKTIFKDFKLEALGYELY